MGLNAILANLDQFKPLSDKLDLFGGAEDRDVAPSKAWDPDDLIRPERKDKETNPYEGEHQAVRGKRDKLRGEVLNKVGNTTRETVKPVDPAFRTPDAAALIFGAALEALGAKGAGMEFLKGLLQGKMSKAQRDTQVKQEEANAKSQEEQDAIRKAELALRFADQDENELAQMSREWIKEKQAEDKARAIEGRSLRQQFLSSNDPGETQMFARILREQFPEYAPTKFEETRKIETLSIPEAKFFNDEARKLKESSYLSDEAELKKFNDKMAAKRGELIARGIPEYLLDPILDVKTLKQQIMENRQANLLFTQSLAEKRFNFDTFDRNRKYLEGIRQFNGRMNWNAAKHRENLTATWARIEISRQNAAIAQQNGDLRRMQIYLNDANQDEKLLVGIVSGHMDYWQKVRNDRVKELRKLKYKPEKIAADPMVQEAEGKIGQYAGELESIGLEARSRVVPESFMTPTQQYQYQVNPNDAGTYSGRVGGGAPPGAVEIGGNLPPFNPFPGGNPTVTPTPTPGDPKPGNNRPTQGGPADKPKANVDPFVELRKKAQAAAADRKKGLKMIAEGYDEAEIRARFEKKYGIKM